jgi:L-2-hydroxyglutarate oxidase LhgO
MDKANVVIIGGGVVGCAIAMQAARRWPDVFLLERLPRLGMLASTRNSGVIHSGLYYTPGSLKAGLCVRGNALLYEFCAAHGVAHRRTGKLVVAATPEEAEELPALVARGERNGVRGLRIVDRAGIRAREPHVAGQAAIEVPSAGIVLAEELVKTCARLATEAGASILTGAGVERLQPAGDAIRVGATQAGEIDARVVVNAAGLFADEVAALLPGRAGAAERRPEGADTPARPYRIYPVRGDYAEISRARSHLVQSLVYPLPHPEGLSLGVHLTRTLWDTVLVGPTARYVSSKDDYESDPEPLEGFARRAQRLLPEITAADLRPAYSGIRAKLVPPGGPGPADFIIERDADFPRVIELIGIESPGLTSALAIAEHVMPLIEETI